MHREHLRLYLDDFHLVRFFQLLSLKVDLIFHFFQLLSQLINLILLLFHLIVEIVLLSLKLHLDFKHLRLRFQFLLLWPGNIILKLRDFSTFRV